VLVPLVFSLAAFLAAFLLFSVQPMVGKMLLPQFGGSQTVWNTCMVFFQGGLLAAYAFVHGLSRRFEARRQGMLHVVVLLLPIAALPIAAGALAPIQSGFALGLVGRLFTLAGLPFFVVAMTAPLLQHWFAGAQHRRSSDPYFLYAASNAGSLLALVSYVTVIEPNLTLKQQSRFWAVGYCCLAGLLLVCSATVWLAPAPASSTEQASEPVAPISWTKRVRWALLALVPSSLLLGATTYLTTDIAPVPLFWVVPLTLYLLSFIVAFANPPSWLRRGCAFALPCAIVATLALLIQPKAAPLWMTFLVHLSTLALAATACHTELALSRPSPAQLTAFYLMIAVGGCLGGLFNAFLAPHLFDWAAEYPLALALVALVVHGGRSAALPGRARKRSPFVLDAALPMLLGAVVYLGMRLWAGRPPAFMTIVPLAACLLFVRRPLRFALGLAVVTALLAHEQDHGRSVVLRHRSFFGVLRVSANYPAGRNSLAHGSTLHGMQWRGRRPADRRQPLMYYYPTGPIGQVLSAYNGTPVTRRVGIVGLGIGSLAAYGEPGDEYTFFEIEPAVERIARDPRYFHYLEDCRCRCRVVLGDARLSLGCEEDGSFGLIILDAFSGDAIPVHLLTREALAIDLAKLADHGLIALHIANNALDLEPAVHALARDAGLAGLSRKERIGELPPDEFNRGRLPTHWVVLARSPHDLSRLAGRPGWRPLSGGSGRAAWTDDYTDLFSLLRWRSVD
jgi:hypothetical protein